MLNKIRKAILASRACVSIIKARHDGNLKKKYIDGKFVDRVHSERKSFSNAGINNFETSNCFFSLSLSLSLTSK